MAPPPGTLRVGRYFLALVGLLVVLYALIVFPGEHHKPKLGIDLAGGTRVVFKAIVPAGTPKPTSSQMSEARQIIEDRINTSGVTGSTVAVQGSNELVVEIPSATRPDIQRLGSASIMNFRGVITPPVPVGCVQSDQGKAYTAAKAPAAASTSAPATGSTSSAPTAPTTGSTAKSSPATSKSQPKAGNSSSGAAPNGARERPLAKASTPVTPKSTAKSGTPATKSGTATTTTGATPTGTSPAASTTPAATAPQRCVSDRDPVATLAKILGTAVPSTEAEFAKLTSTQQQTVSAFLSGFNCPDAVYEPDSPIKNKAGQPYIACDDGTLYSTDGQPSANKVAYLLGDVIVHGRNIDSAASQAPDVTNGGSSTWTVNLTLDSTGGDAWHAWTSKYNDPSAATGTAPSVTTCSASGTPCSDWVGFTLNGQVISAPVTEAVLDTQTQISGTFTQSQADGLAQSLNYGKLSVSFTSESSEHVSATLGKAQLSAAFLAGGIGLALVVLYSLLYYRGLGLVTIASLIVSAGFTYAMLVILGQQIGFTLDLAGIAGFIVALGITADSFVVFFERIKDEVHDGRSLRVAVPRAWVRARRTILSADTVSFLAAAILYYFAAADVKGFAFTLGLSTILDLVVVFLFTHPIVSLLSRSRTFGSPRFTGLNSVREGGIVAYAGEAVPTRQRRGPKRGASTGSSAKIVDGQVITDDDDAPDSEPVDESAPPRRSTQPEAGSAAERAARRRARLRDQGDAKGEQ